MSVRPFTAPHVGLTVPDVEAAIDWYTGTLDLRLLVGPLDVPEDGSPLGLVAEQIYGAGFGGFRFAHLATPDDIGVELFQFARRPERAAHFDYWEPGFNHLGLTAPDMEGAVERILQAGGRARTAVLTIDADQGYRLAYLEDPWGSVIELCSHPYVQMWGP